MATFSGATSQQFFIALSIVLLTLAGALLVSQASFGVAFVVVIGLIVAVFTFINTEFALYALITAMLLSPQIGFGSASGETVRGRGVTVRVDDFLMVIIGLTWFFKTSVQKDLGLFLRTPLNLPIGMYFLACIVSTVFGYMMGRVKGMAGFFFVLKYFEYYMVYFMAVNHIREKKQIQQFLAFMFVICFIVCVVAVYSLFQGVRASAPFEGTEGEPNTLGGYLVFMLSLVLGLILTWGNRTQKILLALLLVAMTVALAATLSRTSWIAIGPIALALLFFSDKKKTVLAFLIIAVIAAPSLAPKSVRDRILFTITQPKETGQIKVGNVKLDTSTSARFESMRRVLVNDFVKQPLIGFGITGYYFLDAQYARVLAESGIVGFLAFLFLLRRIYVNAKRTYKQTNDLFYKGLTIGYIAGFFGLLTHAIGANTFIIVRIMEPFWFMTAMVTMIPVLEEDSPTEEISASPAKPLLHVRSRSASV